MKTFRTLQGGLIAAAVLASIAAGPASAQSPINCGGQPGIQHDNGTGQPWYDCVALGTYNLTQAQQAANAYMMAAGGGTVSNGSCGMGGYASPALSLKTASTCATWVYSGKLAGRVKLNAQSNACACPVSTDPIGWK